MKVELYNQYVRSQMNRRSVLKGAASVGALAAMGGAPPVSYTHLTLPTKA